MGSKERAHLDLNDDDFDLSDFHPVDKSKQPEIDKETITRVAEKSGFQERPVKKKRQRSPYVIQKNIKMRMGMAELLADLTHKAQAGSDQETFELAILALIDKYGYEDLLQRYKELTKV